MAGLPAISLRSAAADGLLRVLFSGWMTARCRLSHPTEPIPKGDYERQVWGTLTRSRPLGRMADVRSVSRLPPE